MILRNAVRSDERYRLGPHVDSLSQGPVSIEPALQAVTATQVYTWLLEQGEAERNACAAILAPELEEVRAQAYAKGCAEGQEAAMKHVTEQQAAALTVLAETARALEAANAEALARLADSCAAVVVEAFTKLGCEVLVRPAAALSAVRAVLDQARAASRYVIYVNPLDLDAIAAHREDIQAALGTVPLELQSDSTLVCGGCRLESNLEKVDADFERQLAELFAVLRTAHSAVGVRD